MKGLVSVIVPVYNIEIRYPNALENCLSSIQNQTYKNIEVILVDDGSTDSSGDICDSFAARDNRFKVFHTENNGISAARNYGIDNSHGEFVFFSDADDLIHPQCIEYLYKLMMANPECELARGGSNIEVSTFVSITSPNYIICDSDYMVKSILCGKLSATPWNQLISRKIIEEVKFRITTFEDLDFNLRVYWRAKKILLLKDITYLWIQRELSDSHKNKIKRVSGNLSTLDYLYYHDVKPNHTDHISYFLWYVYVYFFNDVVPRLHLMNENYRQEVLFKFKTFYAATKKDYMKSDAPIKKKMILPILVRFPKMKKYISIIGKRK